MLCQGLNYDLQFLSMYMTSAVKGFKKMSDYVKKLGKGVSSGSG